jgi:hypothetical protein
MSDIVIPKFKGWTKPKTVLEALERSLEHARDEDKWASGNWFEIDFRLIVTEEYDDSVGDIVEKVDPSSMEQFAKQVEASVCTDIKACSAGIVAIETLDGEALFEYLRNGQEMSEDILMADPIAKGAFEFLADGLRREFGVPSGHDYHTEAIAQVVSINDRVGYSGWSPEGHHAKIVRGFERAVELAREAA